MLHDGRLAHGRICGGIHQRLVRDPRPAFVADHLAGNRRQVSAGAVSGQREARGIATQRGRVFAQPADRVNAFIHRLRRAVLRRQAVVDAHHDRLYGSGQERAQRVVHAGAAQYPATTMEVHDHRWQLARLAQRRRPVYPQWHLVAVARGEARALERDVPEDGAGNPGEGRHLGRDAGSTPANPGRVQVNN